MNKILESLSQRPFLYKTCFGATSLLIFGILILIFPPKENFSLLELPQNPQNSQNLFLNLNQSLIHPLELPVFSLVEGKSLKGAVPPNVFQARVLGVLTEEEEDREITEYIVKEGDTLWSIAKTFGLLPETISSANNLKNNFIEPGQRLIILPVDGVLHIVKEGDRIEDLAKKYQVEREKIIKFNELSEEGNLFLDEILIIPGGKIPEEPKEKPKKQPKKKFAKFSTKNNYPWGYCTWWVAQKRDVPDFWGHAKNWLDNALASGFEVCKGSNCPPRVGAIVSLKSFHSLGHVAYVEEVKGNKIIISEMNFYQFGEMNYRRLKIGDSRIKGYIY